MKRSKTKRAAVQLIEHALFYDAEFKPNTSRKVRVIEILNAPEVKERFVIMEEEINPNTATSSWCAYHYYQSLIEIRHAFKRGLKIDLTPNNYGASTQTAYLLERIDGNPSTNYAESGARSVWSHEAPANSSGTPWFLAPEDDGEICGDWWTYKTAD